jgi:thiol-disulfide isomerase/thioredoxin
MKKNLRTTYWYALALIFTSCRVIAQRQPNSNELFIGDKIGNYRLNITNYHTNSTYTDNFRGKLFIIDFWATWCGGCISETPRLDSLQKQFKDQLIILPVTAESKEVVNSFLKKSKFLRQYNNIPVATDDTLLYKLFKHSLIPHEVWIGKDGKVIAVTESGEVNSKNISAYLKSGSIDLPIKRDVMDWDLQKPLLFEGAGNLKISADKIKYSSILLGYLKGLPSSSKYASKVGNTVKLAATNVSIQLLYQLPFIRYKGNCQMWDLPDINLTYPNRFLWEAKDSSLYNWIGRPEKDWGKVPSDKKYFSYELILPIDDSMNINTFALQDLNRYFGPLYGIQGIIEKRKTKCYVLIRTSTINRIASKGGKPEMEIDNDKNLIHIRNNTLNSFMMFWQSFQMYHTPTPIIDETGYNMPVDLEIQSNIRDIASLNQALQKYDLEFKLTDRDLDMIIIKDIRN